MLYVCPDGHDSDTNDYCSECGLEMMVSVHTNKTITDVIATDSQTASTELCPACKTEREDQQTPFCGVCGYNYVTNQGGGAIHATPPSQSTKVVPSVTQPAGAKQSDHTYSGSSAPHIEIEITFNETISEAPKGTAPRKFSLYDDESLIGRRSKSIAQTVGIDGDDAISRRHLLIIRDLRGEYLARLFDNTNGAMLNGKEMTPGVEAPLAIGDTIAIGTFTLIKVIGI